MGDAENHSILASQVLEAGWPQCEQPEGHYVVALL